MEPGALDDASIEWLEQLPKVELHLHLEGAIPHAALWQLIQKYGGAPGVDSEAALRSRLQYRDFRHFLETWVWKDEFIREYEDFTFFAEAVARDLAGQNIRYVEAFYSPRRALRHGLSVQGVTEALRAGLSRVPQVQVSLVVDFTRDFGPDAADATLSDVNEVRACGVVGVGLGGSEHLFPPEPFAPVYQRARDLGLRTTAHAGEAAGPHSIWGAIRALKVDRIGHGTRAIHDDALIDYLAAHQIGVEACPISNLRTGVVGSLSEHPVRTFLERGVLVCVNTDDPKMFHNSLAEEFFVLQRDAGLSRDDVRRLLLNGIEASWLPPDRKQQLTREFLDSPGWDETATSIA